MKKIIASLLVVFISGSCFCQDSKSTIGAYLGPSIVSLTGEDFLREERQILIRVSGGIEYQFHFSDNTSLISGIGFDGKGNSNSLVLTDVDGNIIGDIKRKFIANYLSIPLKFRLTSKGSTKVFGEVGAFIGFLMSAKQLYPSNPYGENKIDMKEIYAPLDYGASVGLGLLIPIGKEYGMSVSFSENLGLAQVWDNNNGPNINVKTNSLLLKLGFSKSF